jgi:nucleotide-binding universal stress UspA family protein
MNYLVPIDFSEQSQTAADYAASLTKIWSGNLHFLHVMVPVQEESSYVNVKTLNVKKNTVFEMFSFQERVRKLHNVRSGCEILSGEFAGNVMKTAVRERSDLAIVGMQGTGGLREYLYGSHTMELIEETPLAVLAVPNESTFRPFRHIVYVTEYRAGEAQDLASLGRIAAKFKALLSVISINSNASEPQKTRFRESVKSVIPFAAINFEERENENGPAEGLQEFSLTESVDLIGINTDHTELIRKIAGRSLTSEAKFRVDVPVLFFPHVDH